MKIRDKLIILFSIIALVPLLVVGLVSFFSAKTALEQQILGGLESVTNSRISDIFHLIQLRQEQCKELAGTFLSRQLESSGVNDPLDIARMQSHIESIYEEMKLDPGSKASDINKATSIDIIGIWDIKGTIVANTNTDLIGRKMPDHYVKNVKEKASFFAGFQTDALTGEDYLIFLQAIRDYEDDQFAGAILFKVKAQILNEIATNRSGFGKTGEVLIGQKNGDDVQFITELRHIGIEPIIALGSDEGLPMQYAVQGKNDIGVSTDYRGVEVLFVCKYLPDLNWGIVAKTDISEAYAPIYILRNTMALIGLIILVLVIFIAMRITMSFSRPISQAVKVANYVSLGDMTSEINISGVAEIDELGAALSGMQRNMQEMSAVAVAASEGDYDQSVEVKSDKDQLAMAINEMMSTTKDKLWMENGIGETAVLLRGELGIQSIAENVINQLVPYLRAQVGALYILETDVLRFKAGYAFKKKGRTNYDIQVGEGLAGQAAKGQKPILFTDIPEDYLKINSALGETTPKNIIAIPLISNDQLKGVMEIGSMNEVTEVQQQLLEGIAENIAIAISTAESRKMIQELLKESQVQNEELQASEEELRSQQDELERIQMEMQQQIETMNKAAIVSETDPDGNITFVNDKFCEISGYSRKELVGKNHRILKSGKQPDGLFVGMWKAISMGRSWKAEILNKKKGGKDYYWVETTIMPFKDTEGNITKYVGVRFDITEQKNQQEALKQQAEELVSQAEELKVSGEELQESNTELGAQTRKLQTNEEELKVQQEELMQSNRELEEKSDLLEQKNKSIIEKNQELEYSREELQYQTKQLEISSKYKSEFLANMSHELRTPLNSILLLSKLLSENKEENLTDEQVEYTTVVHNSGNSLLELINEILDLSKIEAGKMDVHIEEIQLSEINKSLLNTFKPLTTEKGLKLSIGLDKNSPKTIISDKQRLEQMLKNLLSNAIKFTEKGNVSLKVFTPSDNIQFHTTYLKKGNVIGFQVTDTGIGISQDQQQKVFEAFQQEDGSTRRKYGGTGLGLSLNRMIAKMLGCEITLESTKGQGTTFTIYSPVNSKDAIDNYSQGISETTATKETKISQLSVSDEYVIATLPKEIPDDRKKIKKNDLVILIVEDDTSVAKVLLKFVRNKGYKGIVAVSGDKAIDYTHLYKPYGIFLDIILPVKSGWAVMHELKQDKSTRHIPIYIISSLEAKKESRHEGAVDSTSKPVSQKQIEEALSKIEHVAKDFPKHILIIDANKDHQAAMESYIGNTDKICIPATSAKQGMRILEKEKVDCVVLDMALPDATGYELMEKIRNQKQFESLPIIVYTGKSLSSKDEQKIRKFASTIILKTAESYERLLDEISLFLHLVEEGRVENKKAKKSYTGDTLLNGQKVLLVDDDIRNIFSLTKVMESQKMEVLSANNGKEALEVIQSHPEMDIILMDMMMPEMNGYETIKKIRKDVQFEKLPIIAVTSKAMLGDRDKCIKAGASDYISKPVDTEQLLSLLRVWLYKS